MGKRAETEKADESTVGSGEEKVAGWPTHEGKRARRVAAVGCGGSGQVGARLCFAWVGAPASAMGGAAVLIRSGTGTRLGALWPLGSAAINLA